ncbi:MAG: ABC-2 family transporter protein, partial [Planctomycetes bacterium]|nr:ABC-2 family transporter protein [Planctomycetota bacterium]
MRWAGRYVRLFLAFARFGLARELAFRGNFLVKVAVEVLWLGVLLIFYQTVFTKTTVVADWSEPQYLFFVGCYFAMEGLMETLFLENCNEFADLVRTGTLDFYLLQPIDEQFLITCRSIEWSTASNILMGGAVMVFA